MKTLDPYSDVALAEILALHRSEFLLFLERRVGRHDVAEDILQDTLAQSLEKLGTIRDPAALLAWFYQALRNAAVDYHRRARRGERVEKQLRQEEAAVTGSAEATLARACSCATRVADALKPDYADALRRVEVEGASLKTFAHERGISASNAAVRVCRARDALRRALVAACGTSASRGCSACGCEADDRSDRERASRPSTRLRRAHGSDRGPHRSARGARRARSHGR